MTGRHARRPAPDIAAYMADGEDSDLPGRPARYDPELAAQARAGLAEQARRQGMPWVEQGLISDLPRPAVYGPERGRYRKPGRWARLRALLRRRFTPVKEEQ